MRIPMAVSLRRIQNIYEHHEILENIKITSFVEIVDTFNLYVYFDNSVVIFSDRTDYTADCKMTV